MTKLVFINRFYWPEEPATAQLLTDLAEYLAANGHTAYVITSINKDLKAPTFQVHNGVSIFRIQVKRRGKSSLLLKALDFVEFYIKAFFKQLQLISKNDIVISLTDPPLISVLSFVVCRFKAAKLVIWNHDIYPEIALFCTKLRLFVVLGKIFIPIRNYVWRHCALNIVLGADMKRLLESQLVSTQRVRIIENWAPKGLIRANAHEIKRMRQGWALDEKYLIVYSGNLGRMHDIEGLADLATALTDYPNVHILIIGSGPSIGILRNKVQEDSLTNLSFLDMQPRSKLCETLSSADLHIVALKRGCEAYVFPSKIYGIEAVQVPLLLIGDPESGVAKTILARKLGYVFANTQLNKAVHFINELANDKLKTPQSNYNKSDTLPVSNDSMRSWNHEIEQLLSAL